VRDAVRVRHDRAGNDDPVDYGAAFDRSRFYAGRLNCLGAEVHRAWLIILGASAGIGFSGGLFRLRRGSNRQGG
jgi:hypothetical protein